jgi:prepilin-type N-terminal cleavage/methylation domain-containing protein/prepilin-type processing-associated H-X9-DG protein
VSRRWRGFSLVELLVVIAIIATLVSILLPVVNAARRQMRAVQCASNIRGLMTAMFAYATQSNGCMPPHCTSGLGYEGCTWYDDFRIGRFMQNHTKIGVTNITGGGPAFTCPEDYFGPSQPSRSYAMNLWVVPKTDNWACDPINPNPTGALWRSAAHKYSTRIIFFTERFSENVGINPIRYYQPSGGGVIGDTGLKPGVKFGMTLGMPFPTTSSRWGQEGCDLPYVLHRRPSDQRNGLVWGRVNIGYLDGHVELKRADELADPATGLSRLDTLWSAWDEKTNTP